MLNNNNITIGKKYFWRSRISGHQFRQIKRLFFVDPNATQEARLTGLDRNAINQYVQGIRQRLAEEHDTQSPFSEEAEVDESFFSARRIKGK